VRHGGTDDPPRTGARRERPDRGRGRHARRRRLHRERLRARLVKLGVEGRELKALPGGERLLSERRPHLVVETHTEAIERDCRDLLRRHGYAPQVVEPRLWLVAEGSP